MPADRPLAPAKAYYVVCEVLTQVGAGAAYFSQPPPDRGIRLSVTGLDGVVTLWDMEPGWAKVAGGRLKAHREVTYVKAAAYRIPWAS